MRISELDIRFERFSVHIGGLNLLPGRVYGLIGPNGCGKSTLLKAIAGIQKYSGEAIDYGGLTAREITLAPRKPYILHGTVYKNLVYPLALRGIKPEREVIGRCLAQIGLEGGRYAPSLSSGEQQRLALMRAMIFEPKLLLIDEALSSLDIESVSLFEEMISERRQENPATVIIVSHQLSHIQRLCEYVYFMQDGMIEAEGAMEQMLLHPKNEHLKRYLRNEAIVIGE